jgi:CDP-diacylglycerol pyrophosphatase
MIRLAAIIGALVLVAGPAAAQHFNSDALWKIVHGLCVPDEVDHKDPAPCAVVDLAHGEDKGYAVLKDLLGATQYLVIPTAKVTGIESPSIVAPGAPNYFAAAWDARRFLFGILKRELPRDMVSLAINSQRSRSQEQLHIHVDCVRADVRDMLQDHRAEIGPHWAPVDPLIGSGHYRALRIASADLEGVNPFALLDDGVESTADQMGDHTLVLVGADFADTGPGFILLDDRAGSGDQAGGEELQDHGCTVAKALSSN